MKKWAQKTAGLVLSLFLALGLGSKVVAADEEEALPAPAPTEAVEPAPAPAAETKPADTKPAESKSAEAKPAETKPAEAKPTETKPAEAKAEEAKPAESKSEEAPAPAPTEAAPAPAAETKPTETRPAESKPEETASAEPAAQAQTASVALITEPPAAPAPAAEATAPAAPAPAAETSAPVKTAATGSAANIRGFSAPKKTASSAGEEPAEEDEAEETAPEGPDAAPADGEGSSAAEGTIGLLLEGEEITISRADAGTRSTTITIGGQDVSEQDGWTYDETTDQVGLIDYNYKDIDIVSTGLNGLNIAAAGFNRVRSISSEGDVNVTGTGLLLVDSVTLGTGSSFYLHTPLDVYEDGAGSVAVFLKQEDETYLLVNGGVTGILDEEYSLDGVDLVVPFGTELFLNSGGTLYRKSDNSVVLRYVGLESLDVDKSAENFWDEYAAEETFGALTLGPGASLTVENGATIRMASTNGLEFPMSVNVPKLTFVNDAALVLDGEITGDGEVEFKETTALSGTGTLEARKILIDSTDVLADCDVKFRSSKLCVFGGGTIPRLSLDDGILHLEGGNPGVTIGQLTSSGESGIDNPSALILGSVSSAGTLSLYGTGFAPWLDDNVTLSGSVSGGTVVLSSGLFHLSDGYSLEEGTTLSYGNVIVYDHIGTSDRQTAPLIVSAGKVKKPVLKDGVYTVPLIVVYGTSDGANNEYVSSTVDSWYASEVYYRKNAEGNYVLDFFSDTSYKNGVNPLKDDPDAPFFLEAETLDDAGNLSFISQYKPQDQTLAPEKAIFELGDTYLVRIHLLTIGYPKLPGSPATSTSTSFTGTGILGGAGSLSGGDSKLILSGPKAPDPVPAPAPTSSGKPAAATAPAANAPQNNWRVIVNEDGDYYTVRIFNGAREIVSPGRKMTARMKFTLPAGWNKNAVFAVFRNADGSLTAFKARCSADGTLSFDTDLTGTFALISFPYDGELYSAAFYDAVSELSDIWHLPVRR